MCSDENITVNNESIIINNKTKKIIINEKGDSICIDANNRAQFDKIRSFANTFVDKYNKLDSDPTEQNIEDICMFFETSFEDIFGPGIVTKIFSIDKPSIRLITLFTIEFIKKFSEFNNECDQSMIKHIEENFGQKYFQNSKLR